MLVTINKVHLDVEQTLPEMRLSDVISTLFFTLTCKAAERESPNFINFDHWIDEITFNLCFQSHMLTFYGFSLLNAGNGINAGLVNKFGLPGPVFQLAWP